MLLFLFRFNVSSTMRFANVILEQLRHRSNRWRPVVHRNLYIFKISRRCFSRYRIHYSLIPVEARGLSKPVYICKVSRRSFLSYTPHLDVCGGPRCIETSIRLQDIEALFFRGLVNTIFWYQWRPVVYRNQYTSAKYRGAVFWGIVYTIFWYQWRPVVYRNQYTSAKYHTTLFKVIFYWLLSFVIFMNSVIINRSTTCFCSWAVPLQCPWTSALQNVLLVSQVPVPILMSYIRHHVFYVWISGKNIIFWKIFFGKYFISVHERP